MKRYYHILLMILLVTSCRTIDSLDGLWLSTQAIDSKGVKRSVDRKYLLEIEGDSVVMTYIGNHRTRDFRQFLVEKHAFDRQKGMVWLTKRGKPLDTVLMSFVKKGNLQLSHPGRGHIVLFTKQNDLESYNPVVPADIAGRVFKPAPGSIDARQLRFVNDSTVLEGPEYYTSYYDVLNYKGIYFLSGDNYLGAGDLVIRKDDKGETTLVRFENKPYRYLADEGEPKCRVSDLTGNWKEVQRTSKRNNNASAKETLVITADEVTRFRSGYKVAFKWQLTADGQAMYFPGQGKKKPYVERILDCSDTQLTLNRLAGFNDRDSLVVTYERIDN